MQDHAVCSFRQSDRIDYTKRDRLLILLLMLLLLLVQTELHAMLQLSSVLVYRFTLTC